MALTVGGAIYVAVKPIFKIFLNCAMGYALARNGMLSVETGQNISRIVLNCTMPCLIFNKIVVSLDSGDWKLVGVILLTGILYEVAGIVFGLAIWYLTPNPRYWFGGLLAAAIFNNCSDLPIAYVTTLASGSMFTATDGSRGTAYSVMFLIVMTITLFNLGGYRLVAWDFEREQRARDLETGKHVDCEHVTGEHVDSGQVAGKHVDGEHGKDGRPRRLVEDSTRRNEGTSELVRVCSARVGSETGPDLGLDSLVRVYSHKKQEPAKMFTRRPRDICGRYRRRAVHWLDTHHLGYAAPFLANFARPNAIVVVVSLLIAMVSNLKSLFYQPPGYHGPIPQAPDGLPPLNFALDITGFVGAASVPLGLAMLGATIARLEFKELYPGFWKSVLGMVVLKLVVLPIISVAWVSFLRRVGWIDLDNYMAVFVIVVTSGTPSATAQVYLTAQNTPPGDDHTQLDCLAAYMIFQYCALFVTLTIVVVYALKVLVGF